jgi:hypothetical protein
MSLNSPSTSPISSVITVLYIQLKALKMVPVAYFQASLLQQMAGAIYGLKKPNWALRLSG